MIGWPSQFLSKSLSEYQIFVSVHHYYDKWYSSCATCFVACMRLFLFLIPSFFEIHVPFQRHKVSVAIWKFKNFATLTPAVKLHSLFEHILKHTPCNTYISNLTGFPSMVRLLGINALKKFFLLTFLRNKIKAECIYKLCTYLKIEV